jgi:hypothetical protein
LAIVNCVDIPFREKNIRVFGVHNSRNK